MRDPFFFCLGGRGFADCHGGLKMNIVEMILKSLSGDTLSKLAAAIGESPEAVQKALASIIPLLLSGVGGLAAKPQGAEKLWSTLKSVDTNISDDLGSVLAGAGAEELKKKGTNILEELLGKQGLASLIGPLATFLAGNTALVTKLLPLVAPFLMSFLGKQAKSGGLDLAGLLKLLLSQKGNIAAALPAGLAKGLSGVQGLGDLTSFASSAAQAVNTAGSKAVTDAAESSNWLVPALAIGGLLLAGLWFLNQGKAPVKEAGKAAVEVGEKMKSEAEKAVGTVATGLEKAKEMVEEGVEAVKEGLNPVEALTKNFGGYFDSLGGALDGITDVDTAKAAIPSLEKMGTEFDTLSGLFNKLPEAARGGLSGLIESGQKTLTEKSEKVLGIPGVSELLKPILDGLLAKVVEMLKG